MENNNYEQMTVPMLKNLARERGLTLSKTSPGFYVSEVQVL